MVDAGSCVNKRCCFFLMILLHLLRQQHPHHRFSDEAAMWSSISKRHVRMPTRQPPKLSRLRPNAGSMVSRNVHGRALPVLASPYQSISSSSRRLRWMKYEMPPLLLKCCETSSRMSAIFPSLLTMAQAMMDPCSKRLVADSVYHSLQHFVSSIHYHWHASCFPVRIRTVLAHLLSTTIVRDQMLIAQMLMLRCSGVLCLAWSVKFNRDPAEPPSMNSCVALAIPGQNSWLRP